MENHRAISPPLPPEPKITASPKIKTSRDSVISDTLPSLPSSTTPQTKTRSRATSDARPIIHQQQPIREAVDRAFDQSIDQSPITTQLDPSFIAQVTEAVVKSLVNANLSGAASQSSAPRPPSPFSTSDHATQSSPVFSESSTSAFTPPSPQHDRIRSRDAVNLPSFESISDEPLTAPSVTHSYAAVVEDDVSDVDATDNRDQAFDERRSSRYAMAGESSFDGSVRSTNRDSIRHESVPAPDDGLTTLEKAWRPLFDDTGKPTPRFSQFIRGIASHIIDHYEPKASLIITPAKLLRFLEETRVEDEAYPWRVILGGSTSCNSISTIYRRLLCQYHLTQTNLRESPNLPSLTPQGFEWFMTCLVQAHPDQGYERLSRAIRQLPISNADDPKERFPKELPRRLLPSKPSVQAEQKLIASMAHEPQIRLRNSNSMPPPPPPPPASNQQGPLPERQRQPYSRAPHSNAFDDDDLTGGPSAPIERERKPYIAREGGGKVFTDAEHERQHTQYRTEDFAPPRPLRQNSSSAVFPSSGNTPPDVRSGGRARLNTGPGSQPPVSYTNSSRTARPRSPPLSTSYARSDIGTNDPASLKYSHRMSAPNVDDARYNPRRTAASTSGPPSDEDLRGKPIPLRHNQSANGYDSSYGSTGMPPPLASLDSSVPRQRQSSNPSSFDDRRRSAVPSSSGVPEGWSNANNPASSRHSQSYTAGPGPMNH